jgi:hypothetical protein
MSRAAATRLRSLQAQYFSLFDDILGEDVRQAALLPDGELLDFVNQRFAEPSIVFPRRGVALSAIEYRVAEFAEAVARFWKEHEPALVDSVRALPGSRVQFPYGQYSPTVLRDVKKLAAYFETVAVLDGMVPGANVIDVSDEFWRSELKVIFRKAAILYRLKRLALIDTDVPMLLVFPDIGSKRDGETDDYALSFLRRILPGEFDGYPRVLDIAMGFPDNQLETLLQEAEKSELYRRTLVDFDTTPLSRKVYGLESRKAHSVVSYIRDLPPASRFRTFVLQLWMWFDTYCRDQGSASILGNDLVVGRRMWELHKWHLERTARVNFELAGFSEEELSAVAILEPDVDFLGDISDEELLALRSMDGLQSLRNEMSIERSCLKTMSIDDFPSKARSVARRLLDATVKLETALQEQIAVNKARRRRGLMGLGLAVTLGVASTAIPALAIPATALGLVAGTESIRSVLNDHLAGCRKHKEILARPMGLLYQVYSRTHSSARTTC